MVSFSIKISMKSVGKVPVYGSTISPSDTGTE